MNKAFKLVFMTALVVGLTGIESVGETGHSWRVFNANENTWICHPGGVMLFSTLARTVKPVVIDAVRAVDSVADYIFYDGYLWVSSNAGLYQIDASTQSIERIPLPESDSTAMGKIGQDADYLWLGTDEKLMRFDKLGREWFSFDMPASAGRMVGVWSNGDEVFCLGATMLCRFTASTEKWNTYRLDKPVGNDAVYYPGANAFKMVDGSTVYQYQPESFSWVTTGLGCVPAGVYDEDSVLYFTDGKAVKKVACATGMVSTVNVPNPGAINSIAKTGDTLVLTTDKRIGKYSIKKETLDFTEYDAGMTASTLEKNIPLQSYFILITSDDIATYEKESKAWNHLARSGFKQKVKAFSWNEEECALRYADGYQSALSGSIQSGVGFDWDGYEYDTTFKYRTVLQDTGNGGFKSVFKTDTLIDSVELVKFNKPNFLANINLHTSDKNDRIADVFLNNTSRLSPPSKGIYYRGNRDDRLNSFRLGSLSSEQIASPVMPEVAMEGGAAIVESKSRLSTKDRKVVRLAGGSGYTMTKTVTRIVPYRADGKYKFTTSPVSDSADSAAAVRPDSANREDTLRFVLGSCKVIVDGEELDPVQYTFYYSNGELHFNPMAPVDPGSIIVVEYQVGALPGKKITDIELVPRHRFGKLHYGTLTYSPKDWISTEVGYTGIDRDSLNSIVNLAVPLELRNTGKKMMLLFRPELFYNVNNSSFAGGAELKSRIGDKTGIVFNALYADTDFVSTNTLSRGYGRKTSEYDFTVSHDLRQELPLSYYQHQRFGKDGVENRFSFNAGAHFKGLPFVEINASRTTVGKNDRFDDSVTTIDSLYRLKDKFKVRIYETSSDFLEKITRFYKIGYDLTHSENNMIFHGSDKRNAGRLSTFSFLLSPIQRILMSGEMFYRGNMQIEGMPTSDIRPSLNLQMINAPPGVDLTAINTLYFSRFYREQFCTDTIERSLSVVLNPGVWYAPLGWFAPRAKITNNVQCRFNTTDVSAADIISGLNQKESSMLAKAVGVNIFPTDAILFINMNEWAASDTMKSFTTLNKLQYNHDAGNTVIAEWNYASTSSRHSGNLSYEKLWVSWLRTNATISGDYSRDVSGTIANAGPKLLVIFNLKDVGFIRTLSNTHDIDAKWSRHNGEMSGKPDITYTFGLRVKVRPNIELQVTNTTFKFYRGVFGDFENSTVLLAYF